VVGSIVSQPLAGELPLFILPEAQLLDPVALFVIAPSQLFQVAYAVVGPLLHLTAVQCAIAVAQQIEAGVFPVLVDHLRPVHAALIYG